MRIIAAIAIAAVIALGVAARAYCGTPSPAPLQTVVTVDLSRYAGRWFEVARLPNRFQKGCVGSRADYTLRDDGDMEVVNSCKNEKDGSPRQAKGRAWVPDPASNARLKVSFFWPFRGDYWIIGLGDQYEYSVVASPDRKYFWILSRKTALSDEVYAGIMGRAQRQGFEVDKVIREIPGTRGDGDP